MASSGTSVKGKPYGSEYTALYQSGNIKFVRYNDSKSAKTPMETMTRGRVYVTINAKGNLAAITYYDKANRRTKQIDLDKPHMGISPHTHHGYKHSENDTAKGYAHLTPEEKRMVDRVRRIWQNRHSK